MYSFSLDKEKIIPPSIYTPSSSPTIMFIEKNSFPDPSVNLASDVLYILSPTYHTIPFSLKVEHIIITIVILFTDKMAAPKAQPQSFYKSCLLYEAIIIFV